MTKDYKSTVIAVLNRCCSVTLNTHGLVYLVRGILWLCPASRACIICRQKSSVSACAMQPRKHLSAQYACLASIG